MNIGCILLLYAIQISHSYDIQLEGVMRFDRRLLERMEKDVKLLKNFNVSENNLENFGTKQYSNMLSKADDDNLNLLHLFRKTSEQGKLSIANYHNHITKYAHRKIIDTGDYLKDRLKIKEDISETIEKAIASYLGKLQNYFISIVKEDTNNNIDREFLILDVVETANKYLYSVERTMLNEIIDIYNANISIVDMKIATEFLYKDNCNDKKEEMKFICDELNVCRSYPSFSDYFSDFISELVKLSDKRLEILINGMIDSLKSRDVLFQNILGEVTVNEIMLKIDESFENVSHSRQTFRVLRSIIVSRRKLFRSDDNDLKMRTKANRILLDIIDKSFSLKGDEKLAIEFDNFVSALRHWAGGFRNAIEKVIDNFINYVLQTIKFVWSLNTREEVRTLVDIIFKGTSENKLLSKELFTVGSKLVRGDDVKVQQIY